MPTAPAGGTAAAPLPSSLAAIEAACWDELARAAGEPGHDWRVLTLATVDGTRAAARSVVLREVLPAARRLCFHTDARSPKVAQMRAHPGGTLLAWSPRLRWQLRLAVTLTVADGGPAVAARWAQVRSGAGAQDYRGAQPPGTVLGRAAPIPGPREAGAGDRMAHGSDAQQGLAADDAGAQPRCAHGCDTQVPVADGSDAPSQAPDDPASDGPGGHRDHGDHGHFAIVTAQVEAMDWLALHRDGHRRARFDAAGRAWLAP